jgi:PKD repeat protein
MRKLLLATPLLIAFAIGCQSKTPAGPGVVKITETTTSTSTSTTTSTTTTTSTIPLPTVPMFTFSPVIPEVNQIVTFNAVTSTPGSGRTIEDYDWDFGDGSPLENGIKVTHAYTTAGVYLITLILTDDQGMKTRKTDPINVRPVTP